MDRPDERFAKPGTIWMCGACGKTSRDRYGDKGSSWDESCMLNSVLVKEDSIRRTSEGVFADSVEPCRAREAIGE